MELAAVEDIKFIAKMQKDGLKIDIDNKLNETEIRRNQLIAQQKLKMDEQKLKEKEVEIRR